MPRTLVPTVAVAVVATLLALVLFTPGDVHEPLASDSPPSVRTDADTAETASDVDLVPPGEARSIEHAPATAPDARAPVGARGRVQFVDRDSGDTLAAGRLIAVGADGERHVLDVTDGAIALPSDGTFLAEASSPGHSPRYVIVPSVEAHPEPVRIPLYPAATLELIVLDGSGTRTRAVRADVRVPSAWQYASVLGESFDPAWLAIEPELEIAHPQQLSHWTPIAPALAPDASPAERVARTRALGLDLTTTNGLARGGVDSDDVLRHELLLDGVGADAAPPLSPVFERNRAPRATSDGMGLAFSELPAADGYRWTVSGRMLLSMEPGIDGAVPLGAANRARIGPGAGARSVPFALEPGATVRLAAFLVGDGAIVGAVGPAPDGLDVQWILRLAHDGGFAMRARAIGAPRENVAGGGPRPFTFDALAPHDYHLELCAFTEPDGDVAQVWRQMHTVEVGMGATVDLGTLDVLGPHALSVVVRCVGADGEPIGLAPLEDDASRDAVHRIALRGGDDENSFDGTVAIPTGGEIRAAFRGLRAGRYAIQLPRSSLWSRLPDGYGFYDAPESIVVDVPAVAREEVRFVARRMGIAQVRFGRPEGARTHMLSRAALVTDALRVAVVLRRPHDAAGDVIDGVHVVEHAVGSGRLVVSLPAVDVSQPGWYAHGPIEIVPLATDVDTDVQARELEASELAVEAAAGARLVRRVDESDGSTPDWRAPLVVELAALDGARFDIGSGLESQAYPTADDAPAIPVGGLVPGATYRVRIGMLVPADPSDVVEFVAGAAGTWTEVAVEM